MTDRVQSVAGVKRPYVTFSGMEQYDATSNTTCDFANDCGDVFPDPIV